MVSLGRTRVLCTATVEDRVPNWLRNRGGGWVTAEYAMLPRATASARRAPRTPGTRAGDPAPDRALVARDHRPRRVRRAPDHLDCDVIEADGGTRTAAINGALVALHDAFVTLSNRSALARPPLKARWRRSRWVGGGHALPRPVLRRGLEGAGGHERGDDRSRALRGAPGTGESGDFGAEELRALLSLAARRRASHHRRPAQAVGRLGTAGGLTRRRVGTGAVARGPSGFARTGATPPRSVRA